MREIRAASVSRALTPLFYGPARHGRGLGHGYVEVDGYVIAFTPTGAPRMPDGIECSYVPQHGDRVVVGRGRIEVPGAHILPGPVWDPIPHVGVHLGPRRDVAVDPVRLAGHGEGLTPAGDDLLLGYIAGLVLFRRSFDLAHHVAEVAARRTTALSATLLRHAAKGEVPEQVHTLLVHGDAGPLAHWGRTSGHHVLHGLGLAA